MPQADLGLDPAVQHFVTVAKEFCRILEIEIVPLNRDLVRQLLGIMLNLYAAGLESPEVDPKRKEHEDRIFDSESRQKFFRTVADQLGGDFHYQKIFEPFDVTIAQRSRRVFPMIFRRSISILRKG